MLEKQTQVRTGWQQPAITARAGEGKKERRFQSAGVASKPFRQSRGPDRISRDSCVEKCISRSSSDRAA